MADAAAARVAQASRVFVWTERLREGQRFRNIGQDYLVSGEPQESIFGPPTFAVYVKNTSEQPVFDLVVRSDHGENDHLPRLLPDAFVVFYKPSEATWAVADFRDAGFALWSRGGSGLLIDQGDAGGVATQEVFDL